MRKAKIEITDVKRKGALCLIGVRVKASRYSFRKSFRIQLGIKDVDVVSFKKQLRKVIIEEVRQRKAIEPLKRLAKESFDLEYEV